MFSKDKTELIRYPAGKPGTQYEIPQCVTTIRPYAFRDSKLTSVTIPDGVTVIGDSAFYGCSKITSVTIPEGVTDIAPFSFCGCTSLVSLTIPDSVTRIGNSAFADCTSLISVNIPEHVTVIGENAFGHCTALASVDIPDSVTRIEQRAFADCAALARVSIPETIDLIDVGAFENFKALAEVVFTRCNTPPVLPKNTTQNPLLNVPNHSIEKDAFSGCNSLKSISIPKGIMAIGDGAFRNCEALVSVTFESSITVDFAADSFPGDLFDKWANGDGKAGTYTRDPGSLIWTKQ